MNIRVVTNDDGNLLSVMPIVGQNRYGVMQDIFLVVPITHKTPLEAIEEWEYFQKLNIERRFLNYVMSTEEIEEIVNKLKSEL